MTRPPLKYRSKLDPRAREVTLQKLKAGLKKDMNDLKTLCGVDVCLVMYETPDAPDKVWPSHSEALHLIQEFNDAKLLSPTPELDQKAFHSLNTMTCSTVKYQSLFFLNGVLLFKEQTS
ncbi:agamous-like MADS-box protein AGL80 [Tanacetum coccineum]